MAFKKSNRKLSYVRGIFPASHPGGSVWCQSQQGPVSRRRGTGRLWSLCAGSCCPRRGRPREPLCPAFPGVPGLWPEPLLIALRPAPRLPGPCWRVGLPAPRELLVFVAATATALFQLQHLCPQCGAWQEAQTRGSHCPPRGRGRGRGGDGLSGYLPRAALRGLPGSWPFFCPPQRDRGATGSLWRPRCQAAAPSPPPRLS